MTLDDLSRLIQKYGIPQPRLEALNLLELVSHTPQTKILAGDFKLNKHQIRKLERLVQHRRKLPLAYIKKKKEFYGLNFYVNKNVLVPRPESEDIVDLALSLEVKSGHIYDVGCGSGCLGISYLKTSRLNLKAHFLDISRKALRIAEKNCRRHGINGASFGNENISNLEQGYFPSGCLIMANLPYLDIRRRNSYEKDCPELQSEPRLALYALDNGLDLYRSLFASCRGQNLNIVCETSKDQQADLADLAHNHGYAVKIQKGLATAFTSLERNGMNARQKQNNKSNNQS